MENVYLDISIGGLPAKRIVIQLFGNIVPVTVTNFRSLCTGQHGLGQQTGKPLCYKGSTFHCIIKGLYAQGGDISNGDGSGGESIYGGTFDDENFKLHHDAPFLLSMADYQGKKNSNGSQFYITFKEIPELDGKNVVFGRVVKGQDIVKKMEDVETDPLYEPTRLVIITACGTLNAPATELLPTSESSVGNYKRKSVSPDSYERKRSRTPPNRYGRKRSSPTPDSYGRKRPLSRDIRSRRHSSSPREYYRRNLRTDGNRENEPGYTHRNQRRKYRN